MAKGIESIPGNYAFIDSNNLYIAIREQGWKLDYDRFRKYLSDKYQVTKAFLFIGFLATNDALYTRLQEQGYVLVFKPTLVLADGRVKGNVDAELVLQAMIEYPHYNNAVIVTGDGDYFCLIDYLKKHQKLRKLIVPDRNRYSSLLRKFAANMVFMNDLKSKLEYRSHK